MWVPISQGHLYTLILFNIPYFVSESILNFLYPGTPHFHCSLLLILVYESGVYQNLVLLLQSVAWEPHPS